MKPHLHIAIVLIWHDGKVLCARRRADADHLPGLWEFPGGKCEVDETPDQGATREAREELGVEIRLLAARETIVHDYAERIVTLHPFDAEIIEGDAQPLGSAELRWIAPPDMKKDEFPAANAGLIESLSNLPKSQRVTGEVGTANND